MFEEIKVVDCASIWAQTIGIFTRIYKRTPYRTFYTSVTTHNSEEKTLQGISDCLQLSTQILDARLSLRQQPALVIFTLLGQEGPALTELIERIQFTYNNR